MADYVRKTILSQAYAHIEKIHLTPEQKKEYEVHLSAYQKPRAKIMLGANIVPEVKTKDGSLIVYSTVYGSLADALGPTNDFQRSLAQLYGSSKMLADACILESLFFSKSTKRTLLRAESRTGVVKATKNLFDLVTRLNETKQQESHKRIAIILDELEKKIYFLDEQFQFARDRQLVWGNLYPLLVRLQSAIYRLPINPNEDRLKEYKARVGDMAALVKKFSAASEDRYVGDEGEVDAGADEHGLD